MAENMVNLVRLSANWSLLQLENTFTFILRVIPKLLRRKASISSPAKSKGFCQETKTHSSLSKAVIVAQKVHESLKKLQRSKGSEGDEDVQVTFSGSTLSSTLSVETLEKASLSSSQKGVINTETLLTQVNSVGCMMKFSADKYQFLKKGINRHVYGQWMAIRFRFERKEWQFISNFLLWSASSVLTYCTNTTMFLLINKTLLLKSVFVIQFVGLFEINDTSLLCTV